MIPKGKTNIGILVNKDLYDEFRKQAIDEKMRPGKLLEKVITTYLEWKRAEKGA